MFAIEDPAHRQALLEDKRRAMGSSPSGRLEFRHGLQAEEFAFIGRSRSLRRTGSRLRILVTASLKDVRNCSSNQFNPTAIVDRRSRAIFSPAAATFPTRYQRPRYLSFGRPLGPNTYPIDVNTCFYGKAIALQRADRCIADAL